MVGVAVKVTGVPLQTVVVAVVILTDGATEGLTVIVSEFEVAVDGDAHAEPEVMTQDTI